MTSLPDTTTSIESLERLLGRLRREVRIWIWVESLASIALAAVVIVAATLLLDWLLEPPGWARAAALVAAGAVLAWMFVTRLLLRLGTPLADRSLALAVERRQPELGDTLSTAVGLAAAPRGDVDPGLVKQTTLEAEALVGRVKPGRVFRRRRLIGIALGGLLAAAGLAGGAAVWPDLAGIWTRRMLLLADEPWPRRVRLEAEGFMNGVRTVARGGDVDLVVRAVADSGPPPELIELRILGREGWRTVRMGTRGGGDEAGQVFGHVLESVAEEYQLEVRGGDARLRGLRLAVVEPPAVAAATVRYVLPGYLGGGERLPPFSRVVPVPLGSQVSVSFTATKPLAVATLTARFATAASDDAAGTVLAEITAADPPNATIAATIPVLEADATLTVTATDTDGISAREPFTVVLAAVPDEPPGVAVRLADISLTVTPAARLPVVGTLADDHGLAAATVELARGDDAWSLPIARIRGGEPLVELPADAPEIVSLAPLALQYGDRLTVNVTARDTCGLAGGPNVGTGDTWLLDVVTPEAMQASLEAREILLRRRYEAAIEDLDSARRGLAGEENTDQPADQPDADGMRIVVGRLEEATARAVGEVGEIATAFGGIRNELDLNSLLTSELETRLVVHVADPLAGLAADGLRGLAPACRAFRGGEAAVGEVASRADEAIAALRGVLARMLELESFNEVVEKLRDVIRTQEQIRADTLERQRQRAREALESP